MTCGCATANASKDPAAGLLKTPGQLRKEHQEAQEARQKTHQLEQEARQKEKEERLAKKISEMKTGKTILRKKFKRITKN